MQKKFNEKKNDSSLFIFFIFVFHMKFFFGNSHLLFEQQFDIMKIKLSIYIFLFKKFVDCDFNYEY